MNKIDFKAGSKVVSFRKKSLFIDGDEFLYSEISNIRHSSSKHVFAFECNGQIHHFEQYDLKYEKPIIELFSRINSLNKAARAEAASTEASAPADSADQTSDAPVEEQTPAGDDLPAEVSDSDDNSEEDEESVFAIPTYDSDTEADASEGESPSAIPEEEETAVAKNVESDAETTSEDTADVSEDTDTASGSAEAVTPETEEPAGEKQPDKKEKKKKLKKSFIILAAIVAVIGLLTAGYFWFFGTSDNPNAGPNATNGQNYDDIDQLIDDLDN